MILKMKFGFTDRQTCSQRRPNWELKSCFCWQYGLS